MNKKIAQIFTSFLLFFVVLVFSVGIFSSAVSPAVHAQFEIPFDENDGRLGTSGVEGVDISPANEDRVGFDPNRFSFVTVDATGTSGLVEIIGILLNFVKWVLGGFGVLYSIIAGYRLLVAGGKIDEIAAQEKITIQWIVVGFIVVAIADTAVNSVFFADQGRFLQDTETAKAAARFGASQIREIVNYFVAFVGTIAVLAIVVAGIRMVLNPGNEETTSSQKRVALWAALGLIIINLADRVVFVFFNEGGTQGVNVQAGLVEIAGLTNYILGFLGVVAAASLIYAGVLMISNYGNSEAVEKAKTIVRDVAFGIVIAFSSYTIISAIVRIAG